MSCNGNESCYTKKQGGLSEMVQPEDGQVCVLDNKEQMTWVFEPHEWIWGVARSLSHLDVAYRKPHTPRSTIIWFPSANYGNHMFPPCAMNIGKTPKKPTPIAGQRKATLIIIDHRTNL